MATKLVSKSEHLFQRAQSLIPGGVNSPVRRYAPFPLFVASAKGSRFTTVDDEEYIDYCMAYGALLDGHSYPEVVDEVKGALDRSFIFGQPSEGEVELASLITSLVPSIQMVRLANSGTEAAMHSIRLARAFTGRKKILKFEGGFHGSFDNLLVKAGSGVANQGEPASEGVLRDSAKNTLVARYNDENLLSKVMEDYASELAAVIIEPIQGNIGPIQPKPGFLEKLRNLTRDSGILLIFDEVITGFRLSLGGAQEYYKIRPDLTILGKILGGGLPISAFGGRRDVMEKLAPLGPVYQAGTYSGNPISVAAAVATLRSLKKRANAIYPALERMGVKLRREIATSIERTNVDAQVLGISSMFQIFFSKTPVTDYRSAVSSDTRAYQRYFHSLLSSRVFVPPSQFETCFLSTAHNEDEFATTMEAIETALKTATR